jgi:hypothetical protein
MSNNPPNTKSLFDVWLTVKLLAAAEQAFTEPAIRNHVFNAEPRQTSKGPIPGNGLAPHIRRVGSKVLINHGGFLSWIDKSGANGAGHLTERLRPDPNSPSEEYGGSRAIATRGDEVGTKRAASIVEPLAAGLPQHQIPPKSNDKQRRRRV